MEKHAEKTVGKGERNKYSEQVCRSKLDISSSKLNTIKVYI
jgi:hypothetical protein